MNLWTQSSFPKSPIFVPTGVILFDTFFRCACRTILRVVASLFLRWFLVSNTHIYLPLPPWICETLRSDLDILYMRFATYC